MTDYRWAWIAGGCYFFTVVKKYPPVANRPQDVLPPVTARRDVTW